MKKLSESGLETQIYFFTINVFSFSKTLQKNNSFLTPEILKIANQLYSTFIELLDLENQNDIKKDLKKCISLAKTSHSMFMDFDCEKKELINEKANLQIENSLIIRKLELLVV